MSKWCWNYDSGEYEDIYKDGYSYTQGEYVYNWDDSDYRRGRSAGTLYSASKRIY